MSVSRACQPCRAAKTKCDFIRPICGYCKRHSIVCFGYTNDADFIFRDQTGKAKVDSQRARAGRSRQTGKAATASVAQASIIPATDDASAICQRAMPWLNNSAWSTPFYNSVSRKLDDRALEIFFAEWVLEPCNHKASPGYMHLLPYIKTYAAPNSALHPAVEAFAFANIRDFTLSSGSFAELARSRYGTALAAIRHAVDREGVESDDTLLMAILVIDMFELIHMHREDALGLHSQAIEHLLTVRGIQQVYSSTGFNLYRMAHHRLQVRQLLLGVEPLEIQFECLKKLDTSSPAIKIGAYNLQVQVLCARARQLFEREPGDTDLLQQKVYDLTKQMNNLLLEMTEYMTTVPSSWEPRYIDVATDESVQAVFRAIDLPLIPQIRLYHDPWVAYQVGHGHLGKLTLRTFLLNLLHWCRIAFQGPHSASFESMFGSEISAQQIAINEDADVLKELIPPLIGLAELNDRSHAGGPKKICQLFARAACWGLSYGMYISEERQMFAKKALDWMRRHNDLN